MASKQKMKFEKLFKLLKNSIKNDIYPYNTSKSGSNE